LRVLLMHNPTAGNEEHSPQSLIAALEAAGHDVRWQSTKETAWERALEEEADLVVVAGGDGAVRKVFRELAGTTLLATILPVGTANNIARSLGFPETDPTRLIRAWPGGQTRFCDIASLTSSRGEVRFVESAGGGVFAAVLDLAERGTDDAALDKVERGLRLLLRSLAEAEASTWELRVDDEDRAEALIGLEVMNVREAGPRIPLAPDADAGDGALDVVLIGTEQASALAGYAEERLGGHDPEPPRFDVQRGREIEMRPPTARPLHYDDELLTSGEDEGALVVRPASRLQVLVPRS
jgi:diacylglycerol kinase (ATP)